ncbi:MAG TPA: hypothetical protein VMT76_17340, partial [Puia sp.]|nr:hypothetical protein [Puia sp.]
MKSIEECLDMILEDLVKNWDKPENKRDFLKAEDLLNRFELPDMMRKHEFFIRLVKKLIKEGYAEELVALHNPQSLDHFQDEILITIEGYHFILSGGYVNKAMNHNLEKSKNEVIASSPLVLNRLTKRLIYATVGAA